MNFDAKHHSTQTQSLPNSRATTHHSIRVPSPSKDNNKSSTPKTKRPPKHHFIIKLQTHIYLYRIRTIYHFTSYLHPSHSSKCLLPGSKHASPPSISWTAPPRPCSPDPDPAQGASTWRMSARYGPHCAAESPRVWTKAGAGTQ